MDTKLYVGNLSYTTSEEELRTLFAGAGYGSFRRVDQRPRYRSI